MRCAIGDHGNADGLIEEHRAIGRVVSTENCLTENAAIVALTAARRPVVGVHFAWAEKERQDRGGPLGVFRAVEGLGQRQASVEVFLVEVRQEKDAPSQLAIRRIAGRPPFDASRRKGAMSVVIVM